MVRLYFPLTILLMFGCFAESASSREKPKKAPASKPQVKETLKKPISAPIVKPTIEEDLNKLFERFVNLKETGLSWKKFAQEAIAIFQRDSKYQKLTQAFYDVIDSQSTWYIGYKLSWYKTDLPHSTQNLLDKYSSFALTDIIVFRLKLN
jgi:hypothetical protein